MIVGKYSSDFDCFQSLEGHLIDTYWIFCYMENKLKNQFTKIFHTLKDLWLSCRNEWTLSYKDFIAIIKFLVFIHDIGKATQEFQERLKNAALNKKTRQVFHSFDGFCYLLFNANYDYFDSLLENIVINSFFAILGHHGQLHNDIFQNHYITEAVTSFKHKSEINKIIQNFIDKRFIDEVNKEIRSFLKFFKIKKEKEELNFRRERRKDVQNMIRENINSEDSGDYALFKKYFYGFFYSTLTLCDGLSSRFFQEMIKQPKSVNFVSSLNDRKIFPNMINSINDFKQKINDLDFQLDDIKDIINCLDEIIKNNPILKPKYKPNQIQEAILEEDDVKPNIVIRLGCGMGKTASALLFAKRIGKLKEWSFKNLIFTLPTQFTSNSLLKDMKEYDINEKYLGLYHGNAKEFWENYLSKEEEKSDDVTNKKQIQNFSERHYLSKIYQYPITFTTVDHLILSLIHGFKQADRSIFNIQESLVVFDELHYYEEHTLKIILQLQRILRKWKVPHIVMSGTMPNNLISYYRERDYKIYDWDGKFKNKKERQDRIPYRVILKEEPIIKSNEVSETLLKEIKKKLGYNAKIFFKQIIFVNQVERAKFLTLKLREVLKDYEPEIICYHSQFTREDKIQKENEIKKKFRKNKIKSPIILVTTQISEFSLNISADVMYSEVGPIDSIFQRAGRLHRGGFRPNFNRCKCKRCQFLKKVSQIHDNFEYEFFIFFTENLETDYFEVKNDIEKSKKLNRSILPYDETIIQKTYKILKSNISNNNGYYTFPVICKVVSDVYNYKLRPNVKFFEVFKNNVIFGDKPSHILDFNNKEQSKLIIRPQTYQQVQVIPYCKKLEEKPLKHTISISYKKWFIINKKIESDSNAQDMLILPKEIKYDSDIGLDFSILNRI